MTASVALAVQNLKVKIEKLRVLEDNIRNLVGHWHALSLAESSSVSFEAFVSL